MDTEIKPITAAAFKQQRVESPVNQDKIRRFNAIMENAKTNPVDGNTLAYLHFDEFGYHHEDVSFVEEAGFHLSRNGACLWWEVSLPE